MASIFEYREDDPAFQEFFAQRMEMRALALAHLTRIQEQTRTRLEALLEQEHAVYDEMRQSANGLGDRLRARSAAKRLRREGEHEIRHTLEAQATQVARSWNLGNPSAMLRQGYMDYTHAVADSTDRGALDPILAALPGVRVKQQEDGWRVYTRRSALLGTQELLRVLGNNIIVRGADDDRVRAALIAAKQHCDPPLRIERGTPAFRSAAVRIAAELGIDLDGAPNPAIENAITGTPRQAPKAAAEPENTNEQSPAPPNNDKDDVARDEKNVESPPRSSPADIARAVAASLREASGRGMVADMLDIAAEAEFKGTLMFVTDDDSVGVLDTGAAFVIVPVVAGASAHLNRKVTVDAIPGREPRVSLVDDVTSSVDAPAHGEPRDPASLILARQMVETLSTDFPDCPHVEFMTPSANDLSIEGDLIWVSSVDPGLGIVYSGSELAVVPLQAGLAVGEHVRICAAAGAAPLAEAAPPAEGQASEVTAAPSPKKAPRKRTSLSRKR